LNNLTIQMHRIAKSGKPFFSNSKAASLFATGDFGRYVFKDLKVLFPTAYDE